MKIICEVVVNDILPTLRASLAKELISSYNLNQGEVARLLDVSQPAVSQYLRQLRGKSYVLDNKTVNEQIRELAGQLYSKQIDSSALSGRMCLISKTVIDSGMIKDLGEFHKVDNCAVCR
jgi:hypothetical protein